MSLWFALPVLALEVEYNKDVRNSVSVLIIILFAWTLQRALRVGEELVLQAYDVNVEDNLYARGVHTQVRFARRITVLMIDIIGFASVLMVYERFWQLGASLLTSAGIVGITIGLAAQQTLKNILVGFQLAVTQPIRLDDVVIVEGEWGRVEEITSTYAVVKIWDLRRLIVPLSYFIEKPFQNWTRNSAEMLGTVFFWADYRLPIDEVRAELKRLLEASKWWDKKVCVVHVTQAAERAQEIRCLMSARNSGDAWELRCEVREGLIRWLQQHHPECLPRIRATMEEGGTQELEAARRQRSEQ